MSEIVKYLHVTCQFEAVHHWLGSETVFGRPHLHVFTCEVKLQVFHNEREVELLELRRQVEQFCRSTWGLEPSPDSCETMAETVLQYVLGLHPNRNSKVGVYEMPEAGAWIESFSRSCG